MAALLCSKLLSLLLFSSAMWAATSLDCPTGFANFGDSLTDTGNLASLTPYPDDCDNFPYGETFFGKPSKRFCDGRLVPDFFSLAFRKPLLDPYVHGHATSRTFKYQFGINFAEAGSTAVSSRIFPPTNPIVVYPFQLNQFKKFLSRKLNIELDPNVQEFFPSLTLPHGTRQVNQWLFTIESGGNDLINAIHGGGANPNFGQITATVVPAAVGGILQTIRGLYGMGARRFLIFGIPAQGCSTLYLTSFPPSPTFPRDILGCIIPINNLAQAFNAALLAGIQSVRPALPDATIAGFDYYAANIEIITNPQTHGFTDVFTACCGAPGVGNLNYNPAIGCGHPGSNNCPNPSQHAIWDGVHFTDAFYKVIATFALNGQFTDGDINYASTCNLDFSKF